MRTETQAPDYQCWDLSFPLCFTDGVRQAGAREWWGVDTFTGLAQRSESTEGVCLAVSREKTLSLKTETLSQRMYLRKIFRRWVTFILFMTWNWLCHYQYENIPMTLIEYQSQKQTECWQAGVTPELVGAENTWSLGWFRWGKRI